MNDIFIPIIIGICGGLFIVAIMFFACYRVMRYTAKNVKGKLVDIQIGKNETKIFLQGEYQTFVVTIDSEDIYNELPS